jgi:hypothetical protein
MPRVKVGCGGMSGVYQWIRRLVDQWISKAVFFQSNF